MSRTSSRRRVAALALVVVAAVVPAACGRGDFKDRTAVVTIGGSSETYEVQSCGLDDQTVFVVGRASDGALVQGVMGLKSDDKTGIPASTGLSVDFDPSSDQTRVAAFGAEAWERRGSSGKPPGTISSAKLRGSRIQFSGDVVPVDPLDAPLPDGVPQRFSLDARCDEVE